VEEAGVVKIDLMIQYFDCEINSNVILVCIVFKNRRVLDDCEMIAC